ncbi:MAG: hypothetical protein CM15mP109_15150 [Candidatus Dadabacteria bacterium]|nr:MAG: hypothetical protein CM15mP109_15150 [Candidatus Dadabacteria bacterium]
MCGSKKCFAIMVGGAQTYYNDKVKIYNPESGIFSHCIKELAHIVKLHKGDVSSAYGLPGLGDLHVTSGTGRNGSLGKYLGEGKLYSQIMSQELKDQTVEGAQLIFDLKMTLSKNLMMELLTKQLANFFELIEVITADKKLSIPWENFR